MKVDVVRENPSDFRIPAKLWDLLLEGSQVPGTARNNENDEEMMRSSVIFASLTVVLEERTPGTLMEPMIRIEFPKGGGQIDLARWLTRKPGSFFVRFESDGQNDPASFRAFFLSKAKKRKIEEGLVGSGCRSYLDIRSYMLSSGRDPGIVVNTTRNFASSTLGGHFIFSWQREGVYFVTQAGFVDSDYPQLSCSSMETADLGPKEE